MAFFFVRVGVRFLVLGFGFFSFGVRIYNIDAWFFFVGLSGVLVIVGWKECDIREIRNIGC